MAKRNQRFTSDGKDIVINDVQLSLSILQAVEMPGASDADLIKGLESEIKSDINLQTDWNDAVKWFATVKKVGDWAKNEKYHLVLRTFSLDTFYGDFNKACRDIKSVKAAQSFKFRNYFNLLLRAIRNVKGEPLVIDSSTKLYRGCSIKFPHLVVDEKFLFNQFTSTTLIKAVAEKFAIPNGTLFVVEGIKHGEIGSQSAIGLKNHSAFPDESEVLTNPFHVFQIIKIEDVANSITTVHLKAIS